MEGPKTADPSRYIRYIYNRVILEIATVRACAVSTLAKFGASIEALRVRRGHAIPGWHPTGERFPVGCLVLCGNGVRASLTGALAASL